jgi:imidazolonepropionase-like amidohydrolase
VCRCGCDHRITQQICARLTEQMSRRSVLRALGASFAAAAMGWEPAALAQPAARPILLKGARLFDGKAATLINGRDVLVEGNRITALVPAGQTIDNAQVVDCTGTVIMPGLIDVHWHSLLAAIPLNVAMTSDVAYVHLVAAQEAQRTLMRGFTSVRDVGGPSFALKRAVDENRLPGPRIYPSGAMLSQTAGHGDFRLPSDLPGSALCSLSAAEVAGVSSIADGVPDVLKRTREQLMQGASQIKIMAGGGVSSMFDPLDSIQYTPAEMRAAVDAAADWGTYVCAHVYASAGIDRALTCGVKSIEHGQLANEDTVKRIADAGAWWSIQPFLADEDANPKSNPIQQAQQREIAQGTVRAFELGQKHKVKMAWGTDILFSPAGTATQGRQLAKIARWFSNADVLRLATSRNAELLALSGARNPYPGKLGVIETGALADLLVIDGNPLENINLISDPEAHMKIIMKDGRIYKNTLAA